MQDIERKYDNELIEITDEIEWNKQSDDGFKWAVFVPKVMNRAARRQLKSLNVEVYGYWKIIKQQPQTNCLSEQHLHLIFQLLNHYYKLRINKQYKTDDPSILKQIYVDTKSV
eukprot:509411_1